MSKILIQHFGPIKQGLGSNDGWIEIKKLTVFIGNQGSGKSTVAKVISIMTWLEKAINRGDVSQSLNSSEFKNLFKYQRIDNYFTPTTTLKYKGSLCSITYTSVGDNFIIQKNENTEFNPPKIAYVPAERNFLSVIKSAFGVKDLPDTLYSFAEELRRSQLEFKNQQIDLPLKGLKYKYVQATDASYVIGESYEIDLTESSSGQQSMIPLYLVTKNLTTSILNSTEEGTENISVHHLIRRDGEINELLKKNIEDSDLLKTEISKIYQKYKSTFLFNIVEEPEQNLFPSSQFDLIKSLLHFNNNIPENKLIITTHSPYLLSFITIAIKAGSLYERTINTNQKNIPIQSLLDIYPKYAAIKKEDISIYQMNEMNGKITLLGNYEGIPSDDNFLNNALQLGNEIFDQLLDFEEEWL